MRPGRGAEEGKALALSYSKITGKAGQAAAYLEHVAKAPTRGPTAVAAAQGDAQAAALRAGYYDEGRAAPSAWLGQGAAALGLAGTVDKARFIEILEGRITDRIDVSKRGNRADRMLGTDLTFSAPKSVSLLMVAGDQVRGEALARAHDEAVAEAVAWVERNMAGARVGKGGSGGWRKTGVIIAAAFRHEEARPVDGKADPQLHSHVVIANATRRKNGTWSALRLDFGQKSQKFKTAREVYHAGLEARLQSMGLATRQTADAFELAGVPEAAVKAASRRTDAIKTWLAEHAADPLRPTAEERKAAKTATREGKLQVPASVQRAEWRQAYSQAIDVAAVWAGQVYSETAADALREERAAVGGAGGDGGPDRTGPQEPGETRARQQAAPMTPGERASEAVASAVRHLAERDVFFGCSELLAASLEAARAVGHAVTGPEAEAAIARRPGGLVQAGEVETAEGEGREARYTTREQIERELTIEDRLKAGRGAVPALMTADQARERIEDRQAKSARTYTEGQQAAIVGILAGEDRYSITHGAAGVGKTTMGEAVVAEARAAGFEIIGIAPSHQAVHEMGGTDCDRRMTIAHFIVAGAGEQRGEKPRLYLVDEAGMASTKDAEAITRRIEEEGARAVFIGDVDQLAAVSAGSPLAQAIRRDLVPVHHVREIVRQKNEGLLAVAQAYADGDAVDAWDKLQPYIKDVGQDELSGAVAGAWLAKPEDERRETMCLVAKNATRQEVNALAREGLRSEGTLKGEDRTIEAMDASGLTEEQRRRAASYEPGHLVQMLDDRSVWRVEGREGQTVRMAHAETGEVRDFNPRREAERTIHYQPTELRLAEGDHVVFRENDRGLGIRNGLRGIVREATDRRVQIVTADGNEVTLPARPVALQHGYARTTHSAQGADAEAAIVAGEVLRNADGMANLAYVNVTRAKSRLEVITDNRPALRAAATRWASRDVALDAIDKEGAPAEMQAVADRWRLRKGEASQAEQEFSIGTGAAPSRARPVDMSQVPPVTRPDGDQAAQRSRRERGPRIS